MAPPWADAAWIDVPKVKDLSQQWHKRKLASGTLQRSSFLANMQQLVQNHRL